MIDLSRALPIPGWMGKSELEWLAAQARRVPANGLIAEIGCWQGRSTVAMAANATATVHAIDTWLGSPEHQGELSQHENGWLFSQFLNNVAGLRVLPLNMDSLSAAKMFSTTKPQFDFIFIDANHDYDSVKADILAWEPLVKPNGIFAGHDFYGDWPGVRQAVEELIPHFKIVESIWIMENAAKE